MLGKKKEDHELCINETVRENKAILSLLYKKNK